MSCHRSGCSNIMCNTHVAGIGYVCYDCQNEFRDFLEGNGIVVETEGEIERALKIFMETEKGFYVKGKEKTVDQFFAEHTSN